MFSDMTKPQLNRALPGRRLVARMYRVNATLRFHCLRNQVCRANATAYGVNTHATSTSARFGLSTNTLSSSLHCIYSISLLFPCLLSFPLTLHQTRPCLVDALEFVILVPLVSRRETTAETRLVVVFHLLKFPTHTDRREHTPDECTKKAKKAFGKKTVSWAINKDRNSYQRL